MRPVDFPESNIVFLAGDNANTLDVVGWRGKEDGLDVCVLCYEPTAEERAAIAASAPVWLVVRGRTLPPVRLHVESPFTGEVGAAESKEYGASPNRKTSIQEFDRMVDGVPVTLVSQLHADFDTGCFTVTEYYQRRVGEIPQPDDEPSPQMELPPDDVTTHTVGHVTFAPVPPHMPMRCRRCSSEFMGCDCPDAEHAAQYGTDVREVNACRHCIDLPQDAGVADQLRAAISQIQEKCYEPTHIQMAPEVWRAYLQMYVAAVQRAQAKDRIVGFRAESKAGEVGETITFEIDLLKGRG